MGSASKHYRDVIAPRQATIDAAVKYMRTTKPDAVADLLNRMSVGDEWKAAPQKLADLLAELKYSEDAELRRQAELAAQQILEAAGLPFQFDDYKAVV
jgi:hypothetical protein